MCEGLTTNPNDIRKLDTILDEYVKEHDEFTSEMVRDYLWNTGVKFKTDMNCKRIGQYLSKKYSKCRKNSRTYYIAKTEG